MLTSRLFVGCSITVLILVFCFRCYRTYRVFNDTADEAVHISSGLEMWRNARCPSETHHPPLAAVAVALPAYLAGLGQSDRQRPMDHHNLWTNREPEFYWRTLSMARLGNLIFAPFLLVYVYLWGRHIYGPAAGLVAAALASFSPNLLAHASLATLDFGGATTIFVSAYYLWRWSRQPGLRNCLLAAVTFAVAVLTKFSAFIFLPLMTALFFLHARWRQQPWQPSTRWQAAAKRGALFLGIAGLVVWSGYLFEVGPLPPAQIPPLPGSFGQYVESAIDFFTRHGSLPAPHFVRGILDVMALNARGCAGYLLGELRQSGWWYYFPAALAVKTTLPLLFLVTIGVGLWVVNGERQQARPALDPLLAAAMALAVCMCSRINVGIRHILVIYPFFALVASGLFVGAGQVRSTGKRLLLGLAIALAVWHAAESLLGHPDYLAYFNQIARGREEQFLLDSNLDWGQDLERLRRYLDENRITTVYLSYFGRTDPRRLGIAGARSLEPGLLPVGWVAVSKNHLAGLKRDKSDLAWLAGHSPTARIGKSILVYHLSGGS